MRNFMFIIAKEILDKLIVTYEGPSELKNVQTKILVHEYELFLELLNEAICYIYT